MTYAHYDRLSALDATFLALEDANVHMHVGAVAIFEAKPLATDDGRLDMTRIRRMAGPALSQSRRFRQRLERIPLLDHPVWVDDARFNLDYHLRHTALPAPGDERQLKRLVGRLLSQKLDPHKPLWEMWFVEGLTGDRFAVLTKAHHCMIDGISGVDLMAALIQADPSRRERDAAEGGERWLPRPAPGSARLLLDEVRRRAALALGLLGAGRRAASDPRRALEGAIGSIEGAAELLGSGLAPASMTPLNHPIGPHRRFDWMRMDLAVVKEVKSRLGGTVNDVVLATVSGAMRRFLEARGVAVDGLDFRAQVPVNIRADSQRGRLGNRVATLLARLPVHEADPRRRYAAVVETTRRLKDSSQVRGSELLERLGDWTAKELLAAVVRTTSEQLSFNMTVTNVPGPQFAAYLLGARMVAVYPVVPLFARQGAGIALFSYDGALFWGFNADWDAVPDLHDLVRAVEEEFDTLRELD